MLTILAEAWLSTSRRLEVATFTVGRFDKANTSAKSASPANAGLNRSIELTVLDEPFVAVPAGKLTPV